MSYRTPGHHALLALGLAACALGACAAHQAMAAPSGSARQPAALKIDLDTFEGLKRSVALPDGVRLAYVEVGDPKGPPVVLIHGYTDNARDWVPLLPYLSAKRRLILVDLRGHGASSKPECCYTRYDFAYDIKLLLDALGIARADIIGHSLGSMIAQVFAESWPERTAHVVLISSTGGPLPGSKPHREFDFAAQIRKLKEPLDPDSPFMVAWWDSPTPVDPDFIRRQRRDSARIPLRVWLAILDQGLSDTADLQRTLPALTAPTLLIWGSKDPIMGPEDRASLRQGLPRASVKILPGLGHNPFWEDPRRCAALIEGFLGAPAAR